MLRRKRNKAQSTAEYAIVIGLVIAAAVAMQVYVKRGLQAKMKDAVDYNPPGAVMMSGLPYEPDYLTSSMDSSSSSHQKTKTDYGGKITRTIVAPEESSRTGTQTISAPPTP